MSKITGTRKVLMNLNNKIGKINDKTLPSLLEAVIVIRRDMDKTSPKIPLDTGNLRSSFFTNSVKYANLAKVTFGFAANYAWWVHEMVGAKYKRPGSGAKFMEAAINRNKKKIIEIIKNGAKK